MTPAARLAAAADVLDQWRSGAPAEQVLTTWGRKNRYAGSKDRAAVRDIVFGVLRRYRSCAALGRGETGRALALGWLRGLGEDPDSWFTEARFALSPLSDAERAAPDPLDPLDAIDCPRWLAPELRQSLGADFEPVMRALQDRAPLDLRVNTKLVDVDAAIAGLCAEGVVAAPHPLADTALRVSDGVRKLRQTTLYLSGAVEIQDVAAQSICAEIPWNDGKVLDFCAGGGGKALALAARGVAPIFVHDADPKRMADLPDRAMRAGSAFTTLDRASVPAAGPYATIVADVPCSGSGAWRRQPEAKWALSPTRLTTLRETQSKILDDCVQWLRPGGVLSYVTCSLLQQENEAQVSAFLARTPTVQVIHQRRYSPLDGGDGFFVASFRRIRAG